MNKKTAQALAATRESIIILPHKHLRQRSKKVGVVDDSIRRIVDDMKNATLDWEDNRDHEIGVALAAVQIDQLYRIIVVRNDLENKEDRSFSIFINPKIVKAEGEIIEDFEGCLSVKDLYGKVPRHSKVKVKALDINGDEFRVTVKGFLARIFQHEVDHTNGTLFIDHIKDDDAFFQLSKEGKLVPLDHKSVLETKELWD